MTALSARLAELEALRAKATPRPWAEWNSAVVNPATPARDVFIECDHGPDAALIVAAVNALPELIATLRAVEALAEGYEAYVKDRGRSAPGTLNRGLNIAQTAAALDLRAALAAVTPEADR